MRYDWGDFGSHFLPEAVKAWYESPEKMEKVIKLCHLFASKVRQDESLQIRIRNDGLENTFTDWFKKDQTQTHPQELDQLLTRGEEECAPHKRWLEKYRESCDKICEVCSLIKFRELNR